MSLIENKKKEHTTSNKIKILLFVRDNCNFSADIYKKLNENISIEVTCVKSKMRGETIPNKIQSWNGDYIFCFRSLFILPVSLIRRAKIAAINFHPGPPEYPGSGCINFALYDQVDSYGVTAHLMNEKVDNGEILEVRRFKIKKDDSLLSLLKRTHNKLGTMCLDLINKLINNGNGKSLIAEMVKDFSVEAWNGKARKMRDLEDLQTLDINIKKSELDRIIRATYIDEFPPRIELYGYNFYLNLGKQNKDR